MTFAEALKDARLKLGLSQTALAKAVHVTFTTINRYENGHHMPTPLAEMTLIDFFKQNNIELCYEMNNDDLKL